MKNLLLFVAGLLAALVGLEGLFRVLPTYTVPARAVLGDERPLLAWVPGGTMLYSRGIYCERPTRHTANAYGIVNGGTPDSSGGVWVYGDSFIESQMHDEASTLQGLLSQQFASKNIKVASLNASGAGLVDHLNAVRHVADKVAAPVHVILLSLNDYSESFVYGSSPTPGRNVFRVGADGALRAEYNLRPDGEGVRELAKKSALLRYVFLNLQFRASKLLDDGIADRGPIGETVASPDTTWKRLYRLAVASYLDSLSAATRGQPLLLVQDCDRSALTEQYVLRKPAPVPGLETLLAEDFASAARTKKIPVLDLCSEFAAWMKTHRRTLDMRPVDLHWNEQAHRLAAEAVAASLNAHRMMSSAVR